MSLYDEFQASQSYAVRPVSKQTTTNSQARKHTPNNPTLGKRMRFMASLSYTARRKLSRLSDCYKSIRAWV